MKSKGGFAPNIRKREESDAKREEIGKSMKKLGQIWFLLQIFGIFPFQIGFVPLLSLKITFVSSSKIDVKPVHIMGHINVVVEEQATDDRGSGSCGATISNLAVGSVGFLR